MEILKYTEENLETIAKEKHQPIEEVRSDFEESIRLGLDIYSIKNFISFGSTKVNKDVYFVISKTIDDWYKEDEPQTPKKYTKVSLRHKKMSVHR